VNASVAARRLEQIMTLLPLALDRPRERMALKVRRRQRGSDQYERQARRGEWQQVREGPAKLWVNLTDYLDTGLFLDHRPTRALLGEMARGKRFLNLFCYTGAATVHAALAGAASTVSVDLSKTYLDWAGRNLALNGLGGESHQLIRSDCREWVKHCRRRFDLIFLDPPTFSTSKRMEGTWDVQRDHVALIRETLALLAPGGTLVFSTNLRTFRLDREALAHLDVQDLSRKTLPRDFARNPRIHQCFLIRPGREDPWRQARKQRTHDH
jgi:23S rRNA (guanine2445-N2)-methyltransferase / 23S rRNA (guanine2069-N7)-methyltransferase